MSTFGRGICIITGASKGFGRALAHEVSHFLEPGSILLLVARSGTLLQELKEELHSFNDKQQLIVHCIAVDLNTREGVNETVRIARQEAANEIDHVLLINNAGSLGEISGFENFTDLGMVNSYLSFNVSSALALTAGILQVFPCRAGLRWRVVNVSSIFALQALPSWVLYCTAKAARKMMFSVLAEEEPNVKVLSYSPGPMDTEMQEDILRLTGTSHCLFPCQESAIKLVKLLLGNDFPSGKHLDFFEV
ncbi:sepiapterin reductase-like [Paralichthys olivaceus]|uniref:sepiapterin reductase-like n=1 Tax=Paralichthys olivaceus TaxID=8255 RepID=UPI00097D1353|nr:PREDICTED: sepiapterin reductase-like [Paralichthys olivaceus]